MHACVCVSMCLVEYVVCISADMFVSVCVHMHACMCACVCVCVFLYLSVWNLFVCQLTGLNDLQSSHHPRCIYIYVLAFHVT